MINVYDLYDLHAILVNIRSSVDDEVNYKVVINLISILEKRMYNHELNQFRNALKSIDKLKENKRYEFIFTENQYTYFPLPFLKNEVIYLILIDSCKELLNALSEKNNVKVYDLTDCLHNLPIFLADNNYSIPKRYWKNEIKDYRRKWNKEFLVNEQKLLQKNRTDAYCSITLRE